MLRSVEQFSHPVTGKFFITVNLTLYEKKIRRRSGLRLGLEPWDLTIIPRDEVLMVTSNVQAEEQLTTRLYQIPDSWPMEAKELQATINLVVAPKSWDPKILGPSRGC